MVLTDVLDVVVVRVGSPVGTSDHSVVFTDVMLEQLISHFVCRQEYHLKNSLDRELVRGDVKCLNWNGIIESLCPVSSRNEALLLAIRDGVPKRTIVVRTEEKLWFEGRCVLEWGLSRSRKQAVWEEYRAGRRRAQLVYAYAERALTDRNKSLLAIHKIHGSGGIP